MPKNTSNPLAGPKSEALDITQEAFQMPLEIMSELRHASYREGLSTSDLCRQILGLPIKTKKTGGKRLTISLKPEDYEKLGKRYNLPVNDRQTIRLKIRHDIEAYYLENINSNDK